MDAFALAPIDAVAGSEGTDAGAPTRAVETAVLEVPPATGPVLPTRSRLVAAAAGLALLIAGLVGIGLARSDPRPKPKSPAATPVSTPPSTTTTRPPTTVSVTLPTPTTAAPRPPGPRPAAPKHDRAKPGPGKPHGGKGAARKGKHG